MSYQTHFDRFKQHSVAYCIQIMMVLLINLFLLVVLHIRPNDVLIVSIAATVYIVFTTPHQQAAKPRCVIFGSLVGVVIGIIFSYVAHFWAAHPEIYFSYYSLAIIAAFAVSLTTLITVLFNVAHPPSCAFTLGFVVLNWDLKILAVTVFVILFAAAYQHFLKSSMIDL